MGQPRCFRIERQRRPRRIGDWFIPTDCFSPTEALSLRLKAEPFDWLVMADRDQLQVSQIVEPLVNAVWHHESKSPTKAFCKQIRMSHFQVLCAQVILDQIGTIVFRISAKGVN